MGIEEKCKNLIERWIKWYNQQWNCIRCPANARFDFHLTWNRDINSNPDLWVCEITECGAALSLFNIQWRNVCIINSLFSSQQCPIEGKEPTCPCQTPFK